MVVQITIYLPHLQALHKIKGWGQDFQFAKPRLLKSLEYSTSFLCNEIFTCAKPAVLLFLVLIIYVFLEAELVTAVSEETYNYICHLSPMNCTHCTCTVPPKQPNHSQPVHSAKAVTRPDFSQVASHAGVGLQPARASDHLRYSDTHFLLSLPCFFIAFPLTLVHHNKSSTLHERWQ